MTHRAAFVVAIVLSIGVAQATADAFAEEAEAPESAVSSPPMEMDDPGTPGPRGVELNLVGALTHVGPGRSSEGLFDLNFGFGERLQLKYERPYATEDGGGIDFQQGMGATKVGVKWRFYDKNGLAVATYPAYQFDDAFTLKDESGAPEESEGRSAYLPLLISQSVGRVYTLAANYGFRRSLDHRGDSHFMAVGVGRAMGWDGRIMGVVFSERDESFDDLETDGQVGVAFLPFPKAFEHARFELPVYGSLAHSIGKTGDGHRSLSVVLGMSIVLKPTE